MIDFLTENWRYTSQTIGDALFRGLLVWSYDATLIVLVVVTVAVLLIVRRFTIRQSSLRAATTDLRTLKVLIARTPKSERANRHRYRATRARVARKRLRLELPSAFLSLVIVLSLISWSWGRLEYYPAQPRNPVALSAYVPASQIGEFAHLVPDSQIRITHSLLRLIRLASIDQVPAGRADWLVAIDKPGTYRIQVRTSVKTVPHLLTVGGPFYSAPLQRHGEDYATKVLLRPYKPFGIVPGFAWLALPPWFVAYFVLVFIGFQIARRLLRLS